MTEGVGPEELLPGVIRAHHGRLLSALARHVGDLQLAEDCLQGAYEKALIHWGKRGVPSVPEAWLLRVAQRAAIDQFRSQARFRDRAAEIALLSEEEAAVAERNEIPDDRLRLMFACCHPALEEKTRVALTLVSLGGLTTPEVARAFLDKPATMGQRLSRGRRKIRDAGIAFEIPEGAQLRPRLDSVLNVVYLIFNEGYAATQGEGQLRLSLCEEAIFLSRMLCDLCPDEPEVRGLLALLLVTHARRAARTGADGGYVPLSEQDRGLWVQAEIAEGAQIVTSAMQMGRIGPYQIKAAIGALHGEAAQFDATDWPQIVALYRVLERVAPGPVVTLNLAVALAETDGAAAGLTLLEGLGQALETYQPFHAARADLLRRAERWEDSVAAYDRALALTGVESEAVFLKTRRAAVADRVSQRAKK